MKKASLELNACVECMSSQAYKPWIGSSSYW